MIGDPNATIAGLIIVSDKTSLSVVCGGQQAYPVYLTIGNISKTIHRKLNECATVLLGYLPVDEFSDVQDNSIQAQLKGQLIQDAMAVLLEPLRKASLEGVEMWCADGRLWCIYPMVAAYVADFPEQNLMACTLQSSCPVCTTKQKGRADYKKRAPAQTHRCTLDALRAYFENNDPGELDTLSLKPWWPWWAGLLYVNISVAITPDLLHQIYQGVFKERLMRWLKYLMGDTLDHRYLSMPEAEGLRKFSKGVSKIALWSGRESKDMLKQILPVSVGKVPLKMSQLVCSLVDFRFLAHTLSLTEDDLDEMKRSLAKFHELKPMMINNGYYESSRRFDLIPKIHMLSHYTASIRELGTPDGYNTEGPEHLHIHYAKELWRVSNKVRLLPQMVKHLQRLDAIQIQRAYIHIYYGLGEDMSDDEWEEDDWASEEGSDDWMSEEGGDRGDEAPSDMGLGIGASADSSAGVGSMGDGTGNNDSTQANVGMVVYSRRTLTLESNFDHVFYPAPHVRTAIYPTKAGLRGTHLIEDYGATELLSAVRNCLTLRFRVPTNDILLSRHHKFNVWHHLYIDHSPLSFSPSEPLRRDVVRAFLSTYNPSGRVLRPARFDTALYLERPN